MREALKTQFDRRRILKIGKSAIGIVDVVPPKAKGRPLVLVSGWASTAVVLRRNILALAASGRRVIYVDAPHGIPTRKKRGLPYAQLRKAAALLLALDERRVRRADVVAHSEGAIVAAIAATLEPGRFREIILVNPAGMIKSKGFGKLAADFSAEVIWAEMRKMLAKRRLAKTVLTAWLEAGKTVAVDPLSAWEEVQSISVYDMAGLLGELRKRGIGIKVIHAKGDRTFPVEEVCAKAESAASCRAVIVPGGHTEMYSHPEKFAKIISNILSSP
jgi:pimeloyl-ACP methyl ester carboxylesterase